ncbi:MAG TPA: hypothetical protein VL522_10860, partial [Bordetella sp.]|nr:hypothetical protein [Bordetella sp.]
MLRKACLDTHGCSPCIIIWLIHLRLSVQVPARIHAINSAMPLPEKDLALQTMVGCGGDRLRACFDCTASCMTKVFGPPGQGFGGVGRCPGRAMEEPERCIMVNCAPCYGPGILALEHYWRRATARFDIWARLPTPAGTAQCLYFLELCFFCMAIFHVDFPGWHAHVRVRASISVRAIEELTRAD